MEPLYLELLGPLHISLGTTPLTGFSTAKAQALLLYLAVTQRVHSRDELASLLWCDMPDRQAKKNLRNILPNLRGLVGAHLTIARPSVTFNRERAYHLDVEVFRSALASLPDGLNLQDLHEALALYRGDFLTTFHVRGAPMFEDWVLAEREYLRALAIDGFIALATQCIEQGDYERGLAATQRLLILDPWRETAHQQQMILLTYSGQRSAALAQYETCRAILAEELGVAPLAETTTLCEQIKSGALLPPPTVPSILVQSDSRINPPADWHELPRQPTCYGRETELAHLHQWLVSDGVSMVGLFGIGGQGKTTLAAHLAWTLSNGQGAQPAQSGFQHIIWRSLANASPFTTVLQGWLTCLSGQQVTQIPEQIDEQLAILFGYLQQQRCLLILDNVESILTPEGTFRSDDASYKEIIQQMGQRMHRSCLMIISREQPQGFDLQDMEIGGIRSLYLRGLTEAAAEQLLQALGLSGTCDAIPALVARYSGHPLALRVITRTIQDLFAGDLDAFLTDDPLVFDDLRHVLDQQFAMLSPIEKEILFCLADKREPAPFQMLWESLSHSPSRNTLVEALRGLQRRSLIDIGADGLDLQNVMTQYLTTHLQNR